MIGGDNSPASHDEDQAEEGPRSSLTFVSYFEMHSVINPIYVLI